MQHALCFKRVTVESRKNLVWSTLLVSLEKSGLKKWRKCISVLIKAVPDVRLDKDTPDLEKSMRILKNQTLYQCEYCGRRLLSKAGAKLHEESYCKDEDSPRFVNMRAAQDDCPHEHRETEYSYIPGEAVMQPECEVCLDCGKGGL